MLYHHENQQRGETQQKKKGYSLALMLYARYCMLVLFQYVTLSTLRTIPPIPFLQFHFQQRSVFSHHVNTSIKFMGYIDHSLSQSVLLTQLSSVCKVGSSFSPLPFCSVFYCFFFSHYITTTTAMVTQQPRTNETKERSSHFPFFAFCVHFICDARPNQAKSKRSKYILIEKKE